MILKHKNKEPQIDKTAYIAPNAVICGDVSIGKNVRVMFGAQVIAENSPIQIGDNCIILENAVIRGTEKHPVSIGINCLIGPNAHLAGCTIEDDVFIATGASIFHGALIKRGAEIRIHGVVHLKTVVPENATVPIKWVAVGDPMKVFPPDNHDEIWEIQKQYNFPKTVYGIPRPEKGRSKMPMVSKVMTERLKEHFNDKQIVERMKTSNVGQEFIEQAISRMEENTPRIEKCLDELSEEDIWKRPNESSNSIGNLILHLCGNITQYIISSLGENEDTRERDLEFSAHGGFSKKELMARLKSTIDQSVGIIKEQSEDDLLKERSVQGFNLTGIGIIIHVVEHYSYHTGQIAFWTKLLKDKDLGFYSGIDLNKK